MVKIYNLSKSFRNNLILDNINFEIPNNSIVGLQGKNGAGKSTLINILGGLIDAESGEILFDNIKFSKYNNVQKKQLGCVFESPLYIEKLTGYEFFIFIANMYEFSFNEADSRAKQLLEFLELTSESGKLIEEYSKGMKSKISFGTAIFHNPKYLLLDEPFDGIDENFKPKIIEALKKISSEGGSILITSHDQNILYSLCDYTLKLKDGKIINSDEI